MKKILISISFLSIIIINGLTSVSLAKSNPSDNFAQQALSTHNQLRAQHHVPALIWDNTLAQFAKKHASQCQFKHSGSKYGENIAAGYTTISDAINAWYSEQDKYQYQNPGFSTQTGHFTQLVWKASEKLGCGYANCNGKNGTPGIFWVCEYTPHGNVTNKGYFETNVLPK